MANGTTPAILGLLTWGPMTGYELKSTLESSVGNFWSESFGQIYPELRRLAENGLVTSSSEGEETGKSRRRYAITEAGRDALKNWLAESPKHRPPRNELLLKIFFARQGNLDDVVGYVEETRRLYMSRQAALEKKEDALKVKFQGHPALPFWLMTIRNGKYSYAATVAWCDETIEELKKQQISVIASS